MLVFVIVGLAAGIGLMTFVRSRLLNAEALGWMSEQWLIEYRASHPS